MIRTMYIYLVAKESNPNLGRIIIGDGPPTSIQKQIRKLQCVLLLGTFGACSDTAKIQRWSRSLPMDSDNDYGDSIPDIWASLSA